MDVPPLGWRVLVVLLAAYPARFSQSSETYGDVAGGGGGCDGTDICECPAALYALLRDAGCDVERSECGGARCADALASTHCTSSQLAQLRHVVPGQAVPPYSRECTSSCRGRFFPDDASRKAGLPVCGFTLDSTTGEECGDDAPYLNLKTFGCSPNATFWSSTLAAAPALDCCNTHTCCSNAPDATCTKNIDWVFSDGLLYHPSWYEGSGLTLDSDRRAVQAWLHHLGGHDAGSCERPCGDLTLLNLQFDVDVPTRDPRPQVLGAPTFSLPKFQRACSLTMATTETSAECGDGEDNDGDGAWRCTAFAPSLVPTINSLWHACGAGR
jgi:hypothetical protein